MNTLIIITVVFLLMLLIHLNGKRLNKKFFEQDHFIKIKNGFIWENGKALGVSKSDKIAYVNNLLYKEVFIHKHNGKNLVLDENYKIRK